MAARRELVGNFDYDGDVPADDEFFTGEKLSADTEDDDENSNAQNADDIQRRPVSLLGPREQFRILQSWINKDIEASSKWREQALDDQGFVAGEQLSDQDKALLDAAQRPHIVFNRVLTVVKAVAGMEINGRHEIQFLPTENDDTAVAEILTGASKWMGNGCDAEDEQSEAFRDCMVTGLGWTESRFSYEEKSAGEYIEERIPCREMVWDRGASKKNLTDSRRRARIRKMPLADAMQMFRGKNRVDLDAVWADLGLQDNGEPKSIEEKRIRDGKDSYLDWDDSNEVTIVCIQWWEREPYYLVADEQTNSKVELSVGEYRRLSLRMAQLQMPKLTAARLTRRVFKQAFLGSRMLGEVTPAPCGQRFSWQAMTGEYDQKKKMWYGLIRVMRDPQMWANKFMSQVMHIMNSTAKGGILAERSAFDDQREAEEGYAQPDIITWLKDGALSGQRPKVMPKPGQGDASAYVNLLQYSVSAIKDVTGINPELLGQQDQNQPGILEHMRKQAGMTVLATLFDALRRYRKLVGRVRLFFIQTKLSDGRLIRIVGPQYTGMVQLAKETTTGEYDVVVDDAPTSPNQKEANWAIIQPMLAVFKDQIMGQPDLFAMILEYSPLPSALVSAIKRVIGQAQNDPKKQEEAQRMKELTMAKLLSEVSKNDSVANFNNAKAGTATATAAYDVAIAQNMEHDNNLQRAKTVMDGMKTDAEVELTRAKAARERAGVHHDTASTAIDALRARTEHISAMHSAHSDRVGKLAGAHASLASAFKSRVDGINAARNPPQAMGSGDE